MVNTRCWCLGCNLHKSDMKVVWLLTSLLVLTISVAPTTACQYDFTVPSDVIFIVDRSGSISDASYVAALDTIKSIIRAAFYIKPESDITSSRIALYTFGKGFIKHFDSISSPKEAYECELIASGNGVLDQMKNVTQTRGGEDDLELTIKAVRQIFKTGSTKRPNVTQLLFLATDAHDQTTLNLQQDLPLNEYMSYGLGFGSHLNDTLFKLIVNEPPECYYHTLNEWMTMIRAEVITPKTRNSNPPRNVSDPERCSSVSQTCTSCSCKEYATDPLKCTAFTDATSKPSTIVSTRVTTSFTPEGSSGEKPNTTPSSVTPTTDEDYEPIMESWIFFVLFGVVNVAFCVMWCAFVWMWCCGALDKQFGTAPITSTTRPTVTSRSENERPETLGGNPYTSPTRDPPRNVQQEPELYGNTLVDELLKANNGQVSSSSSGNHTIRADQPLPEYVPTQRQTDSRWSEWSNPSYQESPMATLGEVGIYANSSEQGDYDDENASQTSDDRDEYVNVKDRFTRKYQEIKGRFSALIQSDTKYVNEESINRLRAQHEERQNASHATSTNTSNAPSTSANVSGRMGFFAELNAKISRGKPNKTSRHDYLQPIP